ncbi:late competence development ComFB family protein [Catenovulum sp. SM1970]|uniref:late competence development ComFB family protein n=1 Tax=Marinifaba aquimaris TaxID=2741323 RepID=UPI001571E727|nr:late competence development ComFB family protein [Marinifaba aquimaris]NTS77797.1 late competence development ComFB family protein [Marinifaba aquimaris]
MKLDDDIHNYYEKLVVDKLTDSGLADSKGSDFLADLSCLVLNQLPPKYIRYEVDMAFYLPQAERLQMEMNVNTAIKSALRFLKEKEDSEDAAEK